MTCILTKLQIVYKKPGYKCNIKFIVTTEGRYVVINTQPKTEGYFGEVWGGVWGKLLCNQSSGIHMAQLISELHRVMDTTYCTTDQGDKLGLVCFVLH